MRDRLGGKRLMRRLTTMLFCAVAGSALFASTALATRPPSLSWTLPHTADEGASIQFSWTGRHLGKKHRLVIQKPEGTAYTWRTIMRLNTNSGSAELPPMPLGKYRLRIADLSGHRVLARQVSGIGVFGQVPFSTLFQGSEQTPGVHAGPSYSFPFVASWEDGRSPAFTVQRNHCSLVHIAFVGSGYGKPGTSIVTLVQESRDPVSASAPFDSIGSLDAEVIPGQSWAVNFSEQELPTMYLAYINGYAVCNSTEPFS
jgi:hypothetical protein